MLFPGKGLDWGYPTSNRKWNPQLEISTMWRPILLILPYLLAIGSQEWRESVGLLQAKHKSIPPYKPIKVSKPMASGTLALWGINGKRWKCRLDTNIIS